jgi:glycogen debranching enzyme
MAGSSNNQQRVAFEKVQIQRWPWSLERTEDLEHPYVVAGNRVYSIANQHGEFPEIGWRQPSEMSGVWDHPLKLLDGFWLGITFGEVACPGPVGNIRWLTQASRWRMTPGQVEITYQLPKVELIRHEYGVDDYEGMVIRLEVINRSRKPVPLALHFLARTDLRLAWLGKDRLLWRDGRDEAVYLDELACVAAYNTVNPAYALFGARRRPTAVAIGPELWATQQTEGEGISGRLSYQLDLSAGATEEMIFLIAGSNQSREAAVATYRHLQAEADALCVRQCQRYQQILERNALHCDDELMETAFGWSKATLQMLERNVPGIGQGLAAGLPDYPWWFGNDTAYSVLPLVASGQFELALDSLRTLAHHSETVNGDGSVVHEILTQGRVHHNGFLVETLLFLRACSHAFRWTGDRGFLQEIYDFCKRGLLDVVLGKYDLEGNLCATGGGLVNTRELQHGAGMKTLDIACYTYEALLCLAELASEAGDSALVPDLLEKARRLREFVNSAWWIEEEGLYGDIYISAEALAESHRRLRAEKSLFKDELAGLERTATLLKRFAERHTSEAELRRERPWLLKHMIAATPMETGLATPEHARQALRRLESDEFNGPWGIYLNAETEHVSMTLPNGLMAVAEARYGRMDRALAYCYKIAGTIARRMPGASSDIPPDGGCFIQAWSAYGIIWPVVHYFLGFQPDAAKRRACFAPQLPGSWHTARLQDVRVGSARMNLSVSGAENGLQIVLETSDPSYEITLGWAWPAGREPRRVTLNGTAVLATSEAPAEYSLHASGRPGWNLFQVPSITGLHRYELLVSQECL